MRSGAPSGALRQDQPTTSRALRGGRVPREGLQRDRRRPAFAALQLRVRRRSAASRRTSSASHRSLHNAARLLVTSMAESTPKPTRAMLPAMNPAASATAHSAECLVRATPSLMDPSSSIDARTLTVRPLTALPCDPHEQYCCEEEWGRELHRVRKHAHRSE